MSSDDLMQLADRRVFRQIHPYRGAELDMSRWPATVPAVAHVLAEGLDLETGVTVLAGENGSGKSTLVEVIAEACGLNPQGGSAKARLQTRDSEPGIGGHRSSRRADPGTRPVEHPAVAVARTRTGSGLAAVPRPAANILGAPPRVATHSGRAALTLRRRASGLLQTVGMIRLGTLADLAAATGVFRRASLSNAGDRDNLLAHPEFLILGREGLAEGRTYVAEEDGALVGFASWAETDGTTELEDLFVDPGYMRRGIATALVNRITDVLRERGVERLEVTANPDALGFYRAAGFTACGVAETEFGTAPRMVLSIS